MPVPDAVPLRDAGEPQVRWIKGRKAADIYNEAESRMSGARDLSRSFLLVEQLADGQDLLISDAQALYRATYKAMRSPPRLESDT